MGHLSANLQYKHKERFSRVSMWNCTFLYLSWRLQKWLFGGIYSVNRGSNRPALEFKKAFKMGKMCTASRLERPICHIVPLSRAYPPLSGFPQAHPIALTSPQLGLDHFVKVPVHPEGSLPIGAMIVGKKFDEVSVLSVGAALEGSESAVVPMSWCQTASRYLCPKWSS